MIRVLLVDDHPSVIEGTKMMIENEQDMKVMIANSGTAALEIVGSQPVDVILVDYQMPDMNGLELTREIIHCEPDSKVLIYTGHDITECFNMFIESGVSGIISKTSNREDLIMSIKGALRNHAILPISLVKQLRLVEDEMASRIERPEQIYLNEKEKQILSEIARGKSNKELAHTLLMSQRSIEYALTHIFQKLHVRSRVEAVMKAKEKGLITSE